VGTSFQVQVRSSLQLANAKQVPNTARIHLPASASQKSVLIADGNRAFADALSGALQQCGFVTFSAYTLRELEMITSGVCPDVVLMGRFDPHEESITIAEALQKRSGCRLILLMEAEEKGSVTTKGNNSSGSRITVLRKPVRPAELVQELVRVLGGKKLSLRRPFLVVRGRK
jgi:CheY-like chemotaxis protein